VSDKRYVLVWADGHQEKVWAEPTVRDGCLVLIEHFGVTGGVKSVRTIPLAQLQEWRTDE
jgi:hypothetical protein